MMRAIRITGFFVLALWSLAAYAQDVPAEAPPPAEPAPLAEPAPVAEPALTPIDQVQIQVWIGETNEKGLGDIGTNLVYTRFVRGIEQSGSLQQVNTSLFDPLNPSYGVVLPAPDSTLFPAPMRPDRDAAAIGIQTQGGAGLVASIINAGYGTIDGIFRGIDRTSELDLMSKPELLAVNNTEAEIRAGGQVPYQDIQYDKGRAQLNVVWRDIGVNMKLTPVILPNASDFLQIKITELNVSDITRIDNVRGVDLPVFSQRSQTGEVIVPNGQTLVIGGLTSSVVRKSERRVPIIGKLPVIGLPFRGRQTDNTNTTLLIFVLPTIVNLRELSEEAVTARSFWQTWQNAERIKEEITALEAPDEM